MATSTTKSSGKAIQKRANLFILPFSSQKYFFIFLHHWWFLDLQNKCRWKEWSTGHSMLLMVGFKHFPLQTHCYQHKLEPPTTMFVNFFMKQSWWSHSWNDILDHIICKWQIYSASVFVGSTATLIQRMRHCWSHLNMEFLQCCEGCNQSNQYWQSNTPMLLVDAFNAITDNSTVGEALFSMCWGSFCRFVWKDERMIYQQSWWLKCHHDVWSSPWLLILWVWYACFLWLHLLVKVLSRKVDNNSFWQWQKVGVCCAKTVSVGPIIGGADGCVTSGSVRLWAKSLFQL